MRKIEIDGQVDEAIKLRAEPFVDKSHNDVLRRILEIDLHITQVTNGQKMAGPDQVREILERIIAEDDDLEVLEESSKTYIHFAPRAWTAPELLTGETKSGRILSFMFVNRRSNLKLNLEIQPGKEAVRRRIRDSVRGQRWFTGRKEMAPMYYRVFRKNFFTPREFAAHGRDLRWVENRIRERMSDFKSKEFPQIDQVIRGIPSADSASAVA